MTGINLSDLGIDTEGLRGEIVERAAERIVESIGYQIKSEVLKTVQGQVSRKVNSLIDDTLSQVYQPVDDYGEPVGESTTLRSEFKRAISEWWAEKVGDDGNPTQYRGKPRSEWVAHKVIGEVMTGKMKADFQKLIKESKEQIKDGMTKAVEDAIARYW
jgi:hypothetical protein